METRDLIREIRNELLATPDTVCLQRARLVTEAYQRYEREPAPLRRARALAHVLRRMDLDVTSNPFFAGNTSSRPRAWMLLPEYGIGADAQVLLENPSLDGILEGRIPQDLADYWRDRQFGGNSGIGHLALDLELVVHTGLEALIEQLGRYQDEPDPDRRAYRQAMAIALQAVIDWARRYARAADRATRAARDPLLRALYQRVTCACRRVPAQPARDLFEGLQAIVLVHLALAIEGHGMSISIGLPDRVLAPLVDEDADPDAVTDLLTAFMLKIAANSVFGRGSKTQAITVGGADRYGRDRCNLLTRCFLEACDLARVGDPHLFVRWHDSLPADIRRRAAELLASGLSMPLLINDAPTAQGFVNAGVAPDDAWEYCVIGCNELGIPGRSAESATAVAGNLQYLELLNQILLDHPNPDAIEDMSALLDLIEGTMLQRAFEMRARGLERRREMAERVPMPFTSALMRGCIARGQDFVVGMDYHLPGVYERGLTNAVNALAAIEHVVYNGTLTLGELVAALRDDLRDASIHSRLLAAPKWGNDDPRADCWAYALVEMRERVLDAVDAQFGGWPHMSCHVVRSLHYLDGVRIAASPDGRHAWTPVCDSIGAQTGSARAGPTAILKSVLKLDAARTYRGGTNLNVTLSRQEATPEVLLSLIDGFFGEGGQELQVNCLDATLLRDAQAHPERHGDLIVRVAGFSARFVDLGAAEQCELIERAETVAGC